MASPTKAARQAAAPFRLDFEPRTRHPESTRYSVWCLWLIGLSAGSISKTLLISRSAVLGIIDRSEYRNRSAMTDDERRIYLSELQEIRTQDGRQVDGGRLDAIEWVIRPLSPAKIRPARKAVAS